MKSSESGARLLVVDDSSETVELLQRNLLAQGHQVWTAASVAAAIAILEQQRIDLVITDLKMPGASGFELARHVRENLRETAIMTITGYPSVEGAVQAVKNGAEEYLTKPFTAEELRAAVDRVLAKQRSGTEPLASLACSVWHRNGLLGRHPLFEQALAIAVKATDSEQPVLIHGEPGTGREPFARAIHCQSRRASGPFLVLRCSALPADQVGVEVFGSGRRGRRAAGQGSNLWRAATNGTLFVDDLDQAAPPLQDELVRRLTRRQARREAASPRLIAGIACDPAALVSSGSLRAELLTRANALLIALPPLRVRSSDVALLVRHHAEQCARAWQRRVPKFTDAALDALQRYQWPGNVAELRATVYQVCTGLTGELVDVTDLPPRLRFRFSSRLDAAADRTLEQVEAEHISKVLLGTGNNKARAAEILGIDRKTLREKLRRYRLAT
ncbi:MAG: sigma-54-dependent Fis family transcriptional regulator [Deltaproteobacteria bacterium]|nr:sigma-54-dependent Fis family transcriptional regulator [Deltaproteobacteria bacterium]